ncbi:MAG: hypothetical protein QW390_03955 [Candidatus Bathyarchaeia archaeon]
MLASPPDFTISADPDTLTLAQGGMISSTINVTSLHAFNSSVTLLHSWVGSAPIDVTVNLPATIKPPGGGSETGSLQISAGGSATLGTYTLRINGTSGELSHHVDVAVHVTATTTTATATTESTPTTLTSVTTAVTTETSAATLTATTTPATLTPLTTLTYTTPFAVPGFTPPSTAAGIVIALVLITLIHMVGKRGKNRPD